MLNKIVEEVEKIYSRNKNKKDKEKRIIEMMVKSGLSKDDLKIDKDQADEVKKLLMTPAGYKLLVMMAAQIEDLIKRKEVHTLSGLSSLSGALICYWEGKREKFLKEARKEKK